MRVKQCYGKAPPGVDLKNLPGILFVIEGSDASGRSTQIRLLSEWLEQKGYAVQEVGLKRSKLVGPELNRAKLGNTLSPRTMSLFYAADFYDQLENFIVPALRAGYIVIADRYIHTLMARDLVRGADINWVRSLYSMAIIPDSVYFFMSSIRNLVERRLSLRHNLDYWESGMDLGLSRDWFDSYIRYQKKLNHQFKMLQQEYGYELINVNRSIRTIQRDLRSRVEMKLNELYRQGV